MTTSVLCCGEECGKPAVYRMERQSGPNSVQDVRHACCSTVCMAVALYKTANRADYAVVVTPVVLPIS